MKITCLIRPVVLSTGMMLASAAAGDVESLAKSCAACHGPQGVSSMTKVPTIAGISQAVQADRLYAYRDGESPCPKSPMCGLSAGLSDEQIEAIAEHYASLPFVPAEQTFDAELAARGETLHQQHCEMCHTRGGSRAEDEASILAGQWTGYLGTVLRDYAAGRREPPPGMGPQVQALTEDEIEALLHYYASRQ